MAFSNVYRSTESSASRTTGTARSSPICPSAWTARRLSGPSSFCRALAISAGTASFACIHPSEIAACTRTLSAESSSAFTSAEPTSAVASPIRPSSVAAESRTSSSGDASCATSDGSDLRSSACSAASAALRWARIAVRQSRTSASAASNDTSPPTAANALVSAAASNGDSPCPNRGPAAYSLTAAIFSSARLRTADATARNFGANSPHFAASGLSTRFFAKNSSSMARPSRAITMSSRMPMIVPRPMPSPRSSCVHSWTNIRRSNASSAARAASSRTAASAVGAPVR